MFGACASSETTDTLTDTGISDSETTDTQEQTPPPETGEGVTVNSETLTEAISETEAAFETATETEVASETRTEPETEGTEMLCIMKPDKTTSAFTVVLDLSLTSAPKAEADRICKGLEAAFDAKFRQMEASVESRKRDTEIVIGSANREECVELTATLAEGEYAVKVYPTGDGKGRIVIAYTDRLSRTLAVEFFLTTCIEELGGCLPMDFEARGSSKTDVEQGIIVSDISKLRDPFILVVDDV